MFSQYGNCVLAGSVDWMIEPRHVFGPPARLPFRYASGNSPWPIDIPPESVPALLKIRLFETCRLCAQAWMKTPPPPWEASVMPIPSICEGSHMKLLGYG